MTSEAARLRDILEQLYKSGRNHDFNSVHKACIQGMEWWRKSLEESQANTIRDHELTTVPIRIQELVILFRIADDWAFRLGFLTGEMPRPEIPNLES